MHLLNNPRLHFDAPVRPLHAKPRNSQSDILNCLLFLSEEEANDKPVFPYATFLVKSSLLLPQLQGSIVGRHLLTNL